MLCGLKSSKLVSFHAVTPEPNNSRAEIKFKKTNVELHSKRMAFGAVEILEKDTIQQNLSQPDLLQTFRPQQNLSQPDLLQTFRPQQNLSQPDLFQTFRPTSINLKQDLSIIKETVADDEDLCK